MKRRSAYRREHCVAIRKGARSSGRPRRFRARKQKEATAVNSILTRYFKSANYVKNAAPTPSVRNFHGGSVFSEVRDKYDGLAAGAARIPGVPARSGRPDQVGHRRDADHARTGEDLNVGDITSSSEHPRRRQVHALDIDKYYGDEP